MFLVYLGKKNPLEITLSYLSQGYSFVPGVASFVEDDDGKLLVDRFPATFSVMGDAADTVEEKKADVVIDKALVDMPTVKEAKPIAPEDDIPPDDDFTFETDDEGMNYLCPLCEKTYKVNKGRGKRVMVEHLEKEHAEDWLELQTRPDEG